ncbi:MULTISPECIES: TetR/AcrR family transcriptional regulator [unclassified Streptomyces]|uniref:TetR/AcrR family transcriptional regulator n=1 Tax=unclassified Streptomyces TaxID=2593676 RepID=UPI0036660A08
MLLEAARSRFGRLGYERTTLRDIADDAGVNAALIKRYFESKEGLFKAALAAAPQFLDQAGGAVGDRTALLHALTLQLTAGNGTAPGDHPALMLLRSSGNDQVDALRTKALDDLARRILHAAGGEPPDEGDSRILEAQLVVALGVGVSVLRSTVALQPLSDATADELGPPLRQILDALLPPSAP